MVERCLSPPPCLGHRSTALVSHVNLECLYRPYLPYKCYRFAEAVRNTSNGSGIRDTYGWRSFHTATFPGMSCRPSYSAWVTSKRFLPHPTIDDVVRRCSYSSWMIRPNVWDLGLYIAGTEAIAFRVGLSDSGSGVLPYTYTCRCYLQRLLEGRRRCQLTYST